MGNVITLQDLANETHNDTLIKIADRMSQENEILSDIHWEESTDSNSHTFAFTTYIPKGAFRAYGRGASADASKARQAIAQISEHANPIEADRRLARRFGDEKMYMSRKALDNVEGSSQFLAESIFYGNRAINPLGFNGLNLLFDTLSDERVIGAGGAGADLRSMHLIEWGAGKVYMVRPKGCKVPFEIGKMKELYLTDDDGKRYEGLRVDIYMNCALVVENPNYYMRIANINPNAATGEAGAFHENYLIKAVNKMKARGTRAKIYCDSDMNAAMEIRANEKANVFYNVDGPFGTKVPSYGGRPFRLVEALKPEEAIA